MKNIDSYGVLESGVRIIILSVLTFVVLVIVGSLVYQPLPPTCTQTVNTVQIVGKFILPGKRCVHW